MVELKGAAMTEDEKPICDLCGASEHFVHLVDDGVHLCHQCASEKIADCAADYVAAFHEDKDLTWEQFDRWWRELERVYWKAAAISLSVVLDDLRPR